jgi:hypothetical protein
VSDSSGAQDSIGPFTITVGDGQAPGEATNLTARPGPAKAALSWTNPDEEDFLDVMVRWSRDGCPADETAGTLAYQSTDANLVIADLQKSPWAPPSTPSRPRPTRPSSKFGLPCPGGSLTRSPLQSCMTTA